jgi:hypothetical protein
MPLTSLITAPVAYVAYLWKKKETGAKKTAVCAKVTTWGKGRQQ